MGFTVMRTLLATLALLTWIIGSESFITPLEYGAMLYQNPRGIGCHHCHGEKGEGKEISRYKEDGTLYLVKAPPLKGISEAFLRKGLGRRSLIMPRYQLTDQEIRSLTVFLNSH